MEVKVFVEETINQIVEGVKNAQASGKETGAKINPKGYFLDKSGTIMWGPERTRGGHWQIGQQVGFDISITVSEDDVAAGPSVSRILIQENVDGKIQRSNRANNRITFTVPVFFPNQT